MATELIEEMSVDRILVGIDDSIDAGTAVRWASRLASAYDAEIVLVNVWLAPAEASPTEAHGDEIEERRARLDRLWSREAHNAGAAVRSEVFEGDPRQVLLEVADGEDVDLVVVTRAGEEGESPGLLHLGSVVEYLAHEITRPLAVVPVGMTTRPPARILIGVDGSEESTNAVDWCARLATTTDASVVAVNVQGPLTERPPSGVPDDWLHFLTEQSIPTWTAPITDGGTAVTSVAVRNRRAADGLLDAAAEHEADFVVVGTRGIGGFSGLRVGGTALRLLHRAELPLAVVPTDLST